VERPALSRRHRAEQPDQGGVLPVGGPTAPWNGTSWLNQSTPSPAKAEGDTVLNGVACAQPGHCIAAGSYPDASGISQTLVETGD
jgi:hypothetical protein